MILDLEKRAALILIATWLKISYTFYFVRDLGISMHYLLSRIQHALLEIQIDSRFSSVYGVKFLNLKNAVILEDEIMG